MPEQKNSRVAVYNYDRHDFFFTGIEPADICPRTGKPLLPAFATLIEPPTTEQKGGKISVFSPGEQKWIVVDNNFWHPKFSRRKIRLVHELDGDLSITQMPLLNNRIPYRGVPRVINAATISFALTGRLYYISHRANEIKALYSKSLKGCTPEVLCYQKIASEDLVTQMKRFVDDVFVHEWIELERESVEFKEKRVVRLQAVNEIYKLADGPTKEKLTKMRDEDPEFFQIITDLRNSFAHHLPVAETYNLFGVDYPTVNTIYMRSGDLNAVEVIEVYVEDLTRSFNSFVKRTFDL
jgi:hypothetical protein